MKQTDNITGINNRVVRLKALLSPGDILSCQACGRIIGEVSTGVIEESDDSVQRAYFNHLRRCFALKRLIIKTKYDENIKRLNTPAEIEIKDL
jgi:hypothetical protein